MRKTIILLIAIFALAACQPAQHEGSVSPIPTYAPERIQVIQETGPLPPPQPSETLQSQKERSANVRVLDAPTQVQIGQPIHIKWHIEGPAIEIPQTAIHYGHESTPGALSTDTSPALAGYPEMSQVYSERGVVQPDKFRAQSFEIQLITNTSGPIYFRAHAIMGGKNYWSEERLINVAPVRAIEEVHPSKKQYAVIRSFSFMPNLVRVKKGDTVVWAQEDSVPHTVTVVSGPAKFESGVLSKGQTFNQTFTTPGTYDYTCTIHPNMRGKIIVE